LRWSSRTGRVVDVASEQTVLDAVRAAGVNAPSSCEMGICGTCETKVLSGLVDHRDEPLTDEKAAGKHDDDLCLPRGVPPDQYLE
jgi:ferredoxin